MIGNYRGFKIKEYRILGGIILDAYVPAKTPGGKDKYVDAYDCKGRYTGQVSTYYNKPKYRQRAIDKLKANLDAFILRNESEASLATPA